MVALCRFKRCLPAALLMAGSLHAATLPAGIVAKLPRGFEVMYAASGELDDSGRPGYLVAMDRHIDTEENPSPRILLIFTQNADHTFRLAARNDHVILRADEGGQCDPFLEAQSEGLVIKKRYFTVQHAVACGDHWTYYITFHWNKARRTWLFHKAIGESLERNPEPNGDALINGPSNVRRADPHHPVTFDAWKHG